MEFSENAILCHNFSIGMRLALVEPFYGGSHKLLVDILAEAYPGSQTYTLPAKKWGWHMRTSAVHFARQIPKSVKSIYFIRGRWYRV